MSLSSLGCRRGRHCWWELYLIVTSTSMGFWLGSSLTSTSESELASLVLERNVTERIATERHVATEHHAVPCPTCPVQPPCEKEASRPCDLVQRVPFADYAAQNDLTLEHIFGRDFRAAGPDSEPAVTSNRALEKLFSLLTPYIAAEPHAPLRNTTPPTRLPDVDDLECSSPYFSGFRQTQARVVDILFVGFELDTLEVRLHELDDVVDEFVLFEGMYTQRGNRKPLYFAASENRFAHFLPKITRLVQDATSEKDFGGVRKDDDNDMDDWRNENTMRGLAVQKYLSMHSEEEVRASLFIQGDLDEIPGREAIQKFKFCQPIDDSLNFYYTFLHGTADVVRPQVNAHEKEYWIHGGVRNGEWLLTNPHKFRFVNTMYEASSGGYHLSRIMNPYGWILKLFALAEVDRANGKRKLHCAQLILNPVAYWRECVIRVDDLSGSVHPGWEHPWKDEWVLKRFEDWDGMYSRARSWVIEQNPDRYPWAHAATFGSVSDV